MTLRLCGEIRKRNAVFLVGVLGVLSCARRPDPGPVSAQQHPEIGIQVENQYAASLTIYLETGGLWRRLGQVNIAETVSFVVPSIEASTGVLRLRGEVIGSTERILTDRLRVDAGQIVRWTLAPQLRMSSVALY